MKKWKINKKAKNDVDNNVTQQEHSNNKCYFNLYIYIYIYMCVCVYRILNFKVFTCLC